MSTEELAARFAPVVVLHPEERFAPMSAVDFVSRSSLVWRSSDTDWETVAETGAVVPGRLGSSTDEPYTYRLRDADLPAWRLTRPFQDSEERVTDLPREQGFALVHEDPSPGSVTTSHELAERAAVAPVYYEIQREGSTTRVCYWLFFGSSAPPANALRERALQAAKKAGSWISDFVEDLVPGRRKGIEPEMDLPDVWGLLVRRHAHEGDWEGVTVELSEAGEPGRIHFRTHHGGHFTNVSDLPAGRVTVYCSLGSHACFETPDSPKNTEGDDVPREGVRWDPLAPGSRLVEVSTEPWYGFGGAWGDPGLDHPLHVDVFRKDLAGPLGPSPYKRIWPRE